MLPNLNKLTPWNLEAKHPVYLSDLSIKDTTYNSYTFTELAYFHKSPTIGVELTDITKEARAQNKYLKISAYSPSVKPLRPDLSDIEIALIHSSHGNIPEDTLCSILNITKVRLRQIRVATRPLYKQKNTPLPSLPLLTITDTSKYWTDDELFEAYKITRDDIPSDYGIQYKELLRGLEDQAKSLSLGVNTSIYDKKNNEGRVPKGTSIPSTLLEEDSEDYIGLCSRIWSQVSRGEGVSGLLSYSNGDEDTLINIEYTSNVKIKRKGEDVEVVLKHSHAEDGYNPPLKLPNAIIELAVRYYNAYITNDITPPALERIVVNLLSSLNYTSDTLGFLQPPLSSQRGHTSHSKLKYIKDTPPLIYPKFNHTYDYGVLCHHCSTFLSNNTTTSCPHMQIEVLLLQETGKFKHTVYTMPSVYIYTSQDIKYSLYYYNKDDKGSISQVFTLNLLKLYTDYHIPIHRLPMEP